MNNSVYLKEERKNQKVLVLSIFEISYCNVCNTYFHEDWDNLNPLKNYVCPFCHSNKNLKTYDRLLQIKIDSKTQSKIKFARNTYYEPKNYLM